MAPVSSLIVWTEVPTYRVTVVFKHIGKKTWDFYGRQNAIDAMKRITSTDNVKLRKLTKKEVARAIARKNAEASKAIA